jgi:hypothetical protein
VAPRAEALIGDDSAHDLGVAAVGLRAPRRSERRAGEGRGERRAEGEPRRSARRFYGRSPGGRLLGV